MVSLRSTRRLRTAVHALAAVGAASVLVLGHAPRCGVPGSGVEPDEPGVADADDGEPRTLAAQRRQLFATMQRELGLSAEQMQKVEAVFAGSFVLGQGNPVNTRHPMTRDACRRIRAAAGIVPADVPACGAPGMVPLFDPAAGQTARDAPVCIDQLEFPNIPCEYPVVWVKAREAALLCEAVGKRICDAHEWEGACAGALHDPNVEYAWGRSRRESAWLHNKQRVKVWSYGPTKDHALCATGSNRSASCHGGGYDRCGSNTYPAGAFPLCQSRFGVFDLNGNAAEHMNLPTTPSELASRGGTGFTEMKGSWFIFQTLEAHPDDCRWRAPNWHGSTLMSESSHLNYHLGFRCCKDVARP